MIKAIVAMFLVALGLAGGCQRGDVLGIGASFHRAAARHEVARGCDLSTGGNEKAAAAAFESAAAHEPHNAIAHAHLGRIRAAEGRYSEAVRHYQAAVRNAPDSSEYALALASCLDRLAETSIDRRQALDGAVRAYRYALGLDPHNQEAAICLGVCCRRQGNFAEAITSLREAEEIDSASVRVHNELGATYQDLSDYDKALAEYAKALAVEPDNLAAHNGYGEINLMLSRRSDSDYPLARQRAIAHLRRSLAIEARQPRIKAMLAGLDPSPGEMADAGE